MPDRFLVRISPRAADDLVWICTAIESQSPQNAAIVAVRLIDAIDSLAIFPHRYRVHAYRSDRTRTVHAMPVPPFIVYYRIRQADSTGGQVEILTVLHGHRRQPRRFG